MFSGNVGRKSNLNLNVFKLTSSLEAAGRNLGETVKDFNDSLISSESIYSCLFSQLRQAAISQVPTLSPKRWERNKKRTFQTSTVSPIETLFNASTLCIKQVFIYRVSVLLLRPLWINLVSLHAKFLAPQPNHHLPKNQSKENGDALSDERKL